MQVRADSRGGARTAWQAVRVPGFVVTLGHHPAGSALPRHCHDDPTLCFVLAGGFSEASAGRVADCHPELLKLTPAGEPHSNRFGRTETRGLRIDVDRTRFADVPEVAQALDARYHHRGGHGAALAHRLAGELLRPDAAGPIAVEGLALELVAEVARTRRTVKAGQSPGWLVAAEELVRATYWTATSVAEIATSVGVHPATLSRAYRRHFRCTIGERIRVLRVDYAARLLLQTDQTLSEVALQAGFYDQSHFTTAVRRHLGITPAAYRSAAE
jgi:AraC family transcriptional regulator